MELDRVIKDRRSVRRFKKLDVPWYLIAECLDAAIHAPSSGNSQNWRFVVIRNPDLKKKIVKLCDKQYWALKAPALVVVCSHTDKIRRLYGIRGEALYSVQNCASAIQNFLLKATELDLGVTWIGAFEELELKNLLEIEDDVRPQAILAMGYSDEIEPKSRREPLENVVFFEKYGQREDKEHRNVFPLGNSIKRVAHKLKDKHKKK